MAIHTSLYFEGKTDKGRRVISRNIRYSYDKKTSTFIIPENSISFYLRPNAPHAHIIHPEIRLRNSELKEFTFPTTFRYFDSRSYNAKHKEILAMLTKYGAVITGVDLHDIKLDRQLFYIEETGTATFTISISIV